jgi:hypothetical protein
VGIEASSNGVFLKFMDANGNLDPSKPVIFGKAARLRGKARPAGETEGSEDWLTDLLVAEDESGLNQLPQTSEGLPYTSASSKKVSVHWQTTDAKGNKTVSGLKGQTTIAVGYPLPESEGGRKGRRFLAEGFLVMPEGTQMNASHKLWHAWKHGIEF